MSSAYLPSTGSNFSTRHSLFFHHATILGLSTIVIKEVLWPIVAVLAINYFGLPFSKIMLIFHRKSKKSA